jgi:exosome complex component RRP4
MERKVVIPGEIIIEGDDYLPGDSTEKRNGKIFALKYGLAEEQNNLIKVIPLSGVYYPRRGNVVIGKVEDINSAGWMVDISSADSAFLPMMEVPRFVNKDAMEEVFDIGDMLVAKIWTINRRGIDLSVKSRGFGKIDEGLVFDINPNKVPRVIGKEGSMIKLIKENTNCEITVGQNGVVLVKGPTIDDELFAKKAIIHVCNKSFISGLTDEMNKWFEENTSGNVHSIKEEEEKK